MRFSAPRVLMIAAVAAFFLNQPVSGQQCVSTGGTYYDQWPSTQVITCGSRSFSLVTASFVGKAYAFQIEGCAMGVYPASGATLGSAFIANPFGSSSAYPHYEYRLHHIAVLDDFPYGIVSQSSEGWGLFKINYSASTGVVSSISSVSRYYFGDDHAPSPTRYVNGAKLFRAPNGHVYAVGHYLDEAHFDLQIADMGTGSTTPPMTRVSYVGTNEGSSMFDIIEGPSGPVLYIYTLGGVHLYNVSNPSSPQDLGVNGDEGLKFTNLQLTGVGPAYPRGTSIATVTVNGADRKRLYTYPKQGYFYIYDVTNPAAPELKTKQEIDGGAEDGVGISSDGKLAAVLTRKADGAPMVRYYAVSGDSPRELSHSLVWSSATDPAYGYEIPNDILVIPPATGQTLYKVLRSYEERSYVDYVNIACLDTEPTAGVGVTRSSAAIGTTSCSGPATHGVAAKGFPGDQFVITNSSSGFPVPTVQSIVVTGIDATAGNTAYTSGDIKPASGNSVTWTAPNYLTGEFQITLTLNETSTPAIQYIYLCNDPDPSLVVSQYMAPGGSFQTCDNCGWLQGYTLKLSGQSTEGGPDWSASVWTVEFAPKSDPGTWSTLSSGFSNHGDGTLDLALSDTGTYRVRLDPEYHYADLLPEREAELVLPSGAVTATIVVTQNGNAVAEGGTVLTSQDVNLAWSGQCSGGEANCSFAWNLGSFSCSGGNTNQTCTILAGALGTGNQVNASLAVTHNPSGDSASDTHSFTASSCSSPNSFSNSSPASGATVQPGNVGFTWTAAQGTGTMSYAVRNTLGATLCTTTGLTNCTVSLTAGGVSWFVEATNACGSAATSVTSFTVSGGSSCTSPGTPSLSSPSDNATVSPGTVAFSWGSVSGTTPITYNVKNTLGSTLCSTTGTSCSATLAAGAVQWRVEASNSCSTTNSSWRTLSVNAGSACVTLGTPNLTSPASGATVNPGNVTLSWAAATGTSPTYTVLYNGGLSQACAGTTATTCTINLSSGAMTWWVRATDGCGNSTNSSQRSFTVGTPCTAPGTPVLSSPAAGATVSGNSVTLSWGAVSGDQPITYAAKTTLGSTLCTTTATSCTIPLTADGSFSWLVQASNACSSTSSIVRSFTVNLCAATSVPVANFTVTPAQDSTITVGGVIQKQPYVGQAVTLTNTSAPGPLTDVSWYDFGVAGGVGTLKTTDVTYTWSSAGGKNVRLTVSNCYNGGSQSAEKLKVVTIYADNRPVVADFSPTSGNVGTPATFTAANGAAYGDPDGFSWQFDDETSARSGRTTTRTFECSKQVGLTLTVTGRGKSASTKKSIVISGDPQCCAATAAPSATFSWQETGWLTFQGMQQQQPYAGQLVHFTDPVPNTGTSWRWEFAIQPAAGSPTIVKTDHLPTYTYPSAGTFKVTFTPSNCFGVGAAVEKYVTVYADVRPVTADFACSPSSPAVGVATTCTALDGYNYGDPDGFAWTFPGNVKKSGKQVQHTFGCAGANQVSLVASRGGTASEAKVKTVNSTGTPSCCKPPNRANTPSPTIGATIPGGNIVLGWGRPTLGTDPMRYDVYLDGVKLPECTDLTTLQCETTVLDGTATRFWKVIAKNDCGDTTTYPDTPPEWRFKACSAPTAPENTAFTYSPAGPIVINGVEQQQPYIGQQVTYSYESTVPASTWTWTDYQKSPAVYYDVPHPVVVYSSAGDKKMYLRASNCSGTRSITQYVHVYEDVRPVEARFSILPTSPASFDPVTFTFDTSDEVGNPNEFTIDFGDGTPVETTSSATIQHAYGCAKLYRVAVTARRIKGATKVSSEPHAEDLQVSGYPCLPQEMMVVDIITQLPSADGVTERGDMMIFNPTDEPMRLDVAVRDKDTGQVTTGLQLPPLPPQGSLALADLRGQLNLDFTSATLWFKRSEEGAEALPVINAWRYIEAAGGAKYGQFLPVFQVWPAADQNASRWITGLIHNGSYAERLHTGFITKLTFVDPTLKNPNRTPWGSKRLTLRLYDNQTGRLIATDSLNLDDTRFNGYRQDYLNNYFHLSSTLDLKAVTVEVVIPAGISVVVTSSMFDNVTARAVVFPSQTVK